MCVCDTNPLLAAPLKQPILTTIVFLNLSCFQDFAILGFTLNFLIEYNINQH